jgi:hypothetical protein
MTDDDSNSPERVPTKILGVSGDVTAHIERLRADDPELDAKAEAWAAYFLARGVKRTRVAILETWARLESGVPPWPPKPE